MLRMPHLTRSLRYSIILAVVLIASCGREPENQVVLNGVTEGKLPSKISSVYLRTDGDAKYSQRFRTYLGYALEDQNIRFADSESNADIVIAIHFSLADKTADLSQSLAHTQYLVNGKSTSGTTCHATSFGEKAKFGPDLASGIAQSFHTGYPSVRSVTISPQSKFDAYPEFRDQFIGALKSNGLSAVDSGKANAAIQIDLIRNDVPIVQRVLNYDAHIFAKKDTFDSTETNSIALSTKLASPRSPECISDLDWVQGSSNGLSDSAVRMVKNLIKKNATAEVPPKEKP